ncbi:MAG: cyclic nucleotide-binding domain-containing protein, partial [Devosia sp.]
MGDSPERRPLEDFIGSVPLFAGLSAAQVTQLCWSSRRVAVKAGELIIEEGAPGEALFIILSGELEVSKRDDGRDLVLATRRAGEFLGEMSLLERSPRTASARAKRDSELLEISAPAFDELIETNPSIGTAILRTMAGRLRSTEASLMQREKLASLGTLAAGLAHELNNPAAAIQRSSSYLWEAFETSARRSGEMAALALTEVERRQVAALQMELADMVPSPIESGSGVAENAVMARLEALGVESPWDIAPAMAAFSWTVDRLDAATAGFATPNRNVVLAWLGAQLAARQLVNEIQRSGQAISDIVRAVKSYAYLDQAAVQPVDIERSLEDTLMILKHKLKGSIEIVRDYEPGLPRVEAYAGELNQVWTNLIDNAIDAMDGHGTLTLRARRLGDGIEVRVADTGPGIPVDAVDRVFDPFFTTKRQGIGTGLGLHIAHNIVVNRHRG